MSPSRVLVNLCWLLPGVVGGSEESTTDALRALLATRDGEFELELAVLPAFTAAHPDLAGALRCHVAPFGQGSKARRVLLEQTWLAGLTRRRRPDLVHHAGGVVPLVHPGATVVTIHDLQPLEHPENFGWVKRNYLGAMIGRSARAARVVCVPSRFTADRVVELLGITPDRVVVVPWPVAQRAGTPDAAPAGPEGLYPGWRPGRRFVLYPAITYPHKRHGLLLDAFAELAEQMPELDLVLTGVSGPCEEDLAAAIDARGLRPRVARLGRVPLARLERLYRAAALVALPSNYEGFGLPALEAMTAGVPVVAAAEGSLIELLPRAWTVSGDDPTVWAAALARVLGLTPAQRTERVHTGEAIAASFTPARTATALASAYRMALDGPPPTRPRSDQDD